VFKRRAVRAPRILVATGGRRRRPSANRRRSRAGAQFFWGRAPHKEGKAASLWRLWVAEDWVWSGRFPARFSQRARQRPPQHHGAIRRAGALARRPWQAGMTEQRSVRRLMSKLEVDSAPQQRASTIGPDFPPPHLVAATAEDGRRTQRGAPRNAGPRRDYAAPLDRRAEESRGNSPRTIHRPSSGSWRRCWVGCAIACSTAGNSSTRAMNEVGTARKHLRPAIAPHGLPVLFFFV